MTDYVELQMLTHFSLLRGASSPDELFAAAALLGYPALGVCDIGTVAGRRRPPRSITARPGAAAAPVCLPARHAAAASTPR